MYSTEPDSFEKYENQRFSILLHRPSRKTSRKHLLILFQLHRSNVILSVDKMMNLARYVQVLGEPTPNKIWYEMFLYMPAGSGCLPFIVTRDNFIQKSSIKVFRWQGDLSKLKPFKKSVVDHYVCSSKKKCIARTKLMRAIILQWYHCTNIKEKCKTLINTVPNHL